LQLSHESRSPSLFLNPVVFFNYLFLSGFQFILAMLLSFRLVMQSVGRSRVQQLDACRLSVSHPLLFPAALLLIIVLLIPLLLICLTGAVPVSLAALV